MREKGSSVIREPEHDPNDAVLVTVLYVRDKKFQMNFKIPGMEGNVLASRMHEKPLADMIVKALRVQFGPRVDVI